jgi:hypothetical protein
MKGLATSHRVVLTDSRPVLHTFRVDSQDVLGNIGPTA